MDATPTGVVKIKRPRQKKPIPLSGDTLSTGVKIEKATPTQLNMESGRTIKHAVLLLGDGKTTEDAEYLATMERVAMLLSLAKERLKQEATCLPADHPHRIAIEAL